MHGSQKIKWVFSQKKWENPPNNPMFNRGFHYFHHPFWGTSMFGNIMKHPNVCSYPPESSLKGEGAKPLSSLSGTRLGALNFFVLQALQLQDLGAFSHHVTPVTCLQPGTRWTKNICSVASIICHRRRKWPKIPGASETPAYPPCQRALLWGGRTTFGVGSYTSWPFLI